MKTPINADALPFANWARAVTSVYSFFAGFGDFVRSVDRAIAAAEVSRDLFNLSNEELAARGLTQADVSNYVARKLGVFVTEANAANDDARIAA
ncbi:MAG: hypothetical protein ACM30I_17200 [Gemmatimonas sp.]